MDVELLTMSPAFETESTPIISSNLSEITPKAPRQPYKFNIHPLIKLSVYLFINILVFAPFFRPYRVGLLFIEVLLAVAIKFNIRQFWGFIKLLLLNFIPIYFLFYLASLNWLAALVTFGSYALTLWVMLFATFIFVQATPPFELILALRLLHVPKSLAFTLTIAISWLPFIAEEIKRILIIQRARGYRLRLTRLGPVIIPAVLALMDYSINLSNSMRSRGFEL